MLRLRTAYSSGQHTWLEVKPGNILKGLSEDTDYLITLGNVVSPRLFIDDVELKPSSSGAFQWRPCFYAGRVLVEVTQPSVNSHTYWLDVSPTKQKSSDIQFEEMVTEIREFDTKLLGGPSAAVMAFGRGGQAGMFTDDILLSRIRAHGESFLSTVETISRTPHLSISADSQVLPLSHIRKLHPSALRDRRVLALVAGNASNVESLNTIQLRSVTSSPTFDTPANQTLLALLKRFLATVRLLRRKVETRTLGIKSEEQDARVEHRLRALDELESRASKLVMGRPFSVTTKAETSSSGLTQISAQPIYSKAYRLGSRSLAVGVDGTDKSDALHVNHSWGIYETWCYLAVLECINDLVGNKLKLSQSKTVRADLSFSTEIATGVSIEVLFQANFPSITPSQGRQGYSISKLRIPDIVLVRKSGDTVRSLILDAKWRSGKENVLDAMQSAHIYHDSLRIVNAAPSLCLLLLPGNQTVPELEMEEFIFTHRVGAISEFSVGMQGKDKLRKLLSSWLEL